MADLFTRDPLLDETARILPRWQQEGSSVVNVADEFADGTGTLYTVSSGKKLYVTDISVSCDAAGEFYLRDGSSEFFRTHLNDTTVVQHFNFSTPIEITSDINYVNVGSNADVAIVISGWEEDA